MFGKQATLTVRAVTCCEIVVIDFDKIRVLLEKYPLLKRYVLQTKKQITCLSKISLMIKNILSGNCHFFRQIEEFQSEPKCYTTLVETAEKILKRQSHVKESDVAQRQKFTLAFQGRRFSKKTKCCEYFEKHNSIHYIYSQHLPIIMNQCNYGNKI